MGMFDNVKCLYPLTISGLENEKWQTKDTPAQFLDDYEIREDGTLWHEEYDIADHSNPVETGFKRLKGMLTKINKKWVFEKDFTGEIVIYTCINNDADKYIEFSFYFHMGKLKLMYLISPKEN